MFCECSLRENSFHISYCKNIYIYKNFFLCMPSKKITRKQIICTANIFEDLVRCNVQTNQKSVFSPPTLSL